MGARNKIPLAKKLQKLESELNALEADLNELPMMKYKKPAVIPWFKIITGENDLGDYFRRPKLAH